MENLDTIELFIDEENREDGIYAISLVEFPAIEENFVALSQHKVEFKTLDEDKRIVVGLALVPDKKIYRRKKDYEYNITFSKDTVIADTGGLLRDPEFRIGLALMVFVPFFLLKLMKLIKINIFFIKGAFKLFWSNTPCV